VFKRPSSRRNESNKQITLNLVPVLDAMVTLIAFLLFTMSFIALVSIESPFPTVNPAEVQEKIKEKPLQLTVTLKENEAEIWSPFERIVSKKIQNITPGQPDIRGIHDALVLIKLKFPQETKVVLIPFPGATYDILISLMDSLRALEATDPPVFVKNEKTGNDAPLKTLFPEVIFGNLLGDS
jgi:biopolymer transport protein ExbD